MEPQYETDLEKQESDFESFSKRNSSGHIVITESNSFSSIDFYPESLMDEKILDLEQVDIQMPELIEEAF